MSDAPLELPYAVALTSVLAFLIGVYYWFLFIYGPKFMKNREPYQFPNILRVYNLFQMIICSIFVYKTYTIGFDYRFLWKCESFSFLSDEDVFVINYGTWCFLSLRIFEFIETVFFVLRKKQSQASFLHIYHHISTVILVWVYIICDTGDIFFYIFM